MKGTTIYLVCLLLLGTVAANANVISMDSNYLVCSGCFETTVGPASKGWGCPSVVIKKLEDGTFYGTRNNGEKSWLQRSFSFFEITPFAVSADQNVFRAQFPSKLNPYLRIILTGAREIRIDGKLGRISTTPVLYQTDSPSLEVECEEKNELVSNADIGYYDINDENIQELIRIK